jgi:hypothetical protein
MNENISDLKELLHNIIKPDAMDKWLQTPNKAFDNKTPLEVWNSGNKIAIKQMVDQILFSVS